MTASPISVSSARAQEKPTTEEIVKEGEDLGLSDEDAADDTEAEDVSRIVTNDPTLLTQAEIDLLQRLADRRESLVDREKEMELRQGLLAAAEARIEKKIAELREFQSTIEKLIKTYDEQQIAKIQSLVKIYENMKPKDAARIFEEMGMDTLLLVTERMSERKLAPIMAKMDPAKATEMTVELSRLRDLPNESMKAGG
jgi:flagellar motility protein MotE (MotC chaperone)